MPSKVDKISISNSKLDKRVKLTDEDRKNIVKEYETGIISMRKLAEKYGVSRRLIQFTIFPNRKEIAKKQFAERQKDGRYYDKNKHKEYMKNHREHKNDLYDKGLLKQD